MPPRIKKTLPALLVGLAAMLAGWAAAQAGMQDVQADEEKMRSWMQGDVSQEDVQRLSDATRENPLVLHQREVATLAGGQTLLEECRAYAKDAQRLGGNATNETQGQQGDGSMAAGAQPYGAESRTMDGKTRHWMNETERRQLEEAYAAINYGELRPVAVLGNGALLLAHGEQQGQAMHFVLEPAMLGEDGFVFGEHVVGTLEGDQVAVMECALRVQQDGQQQQQQEQQQQQQPETDVVVVEES